MRQLSRRKELSTGVSDKLENSPLAWSAPTFAVVFGDSDLARFPCLLTWRMLVATLPFARTLTCYTSSSTFIDLFHSLTANFSIEKTFRSSVIQLGLHSSKISSTLLASKDSIQTKNTTIPKTSYFVNLVNGLRKQPWRHSEGKKHTFQRHSGLYYIGDQVQIKSETSNSDCFGAPQASLNQNLTQHKSLALRTPKFVFLLSPTSLKGGRSEKEILVSGRLCVDSGFVDAEVIAALTQMFGWLSGDVPLIPAQSGQKDADCREPDDTDVSPNRVWQKIYAEVSRKMEIWIIHQSTSESLVPKEQPERSQQNQKV